MVCCGRHHTPLERFPQLDFLKIRESTNAERSGVEEVSLTRSQQRIVTAISLMKSTYDKGVRHRVWRCTLVRTASSRALDLEIKAEARLLKIAASPSSCPSSRNLPTPSRSSLPPSWSTPPRAAGCNSTLRRPRSTCRQQGRERSERVP